MTAVWGRASLVMTTISAQQSLRHTLMSMRDNQTTVSNRCEAGSLMVWGQWQDGVLWAVCGLGGGDALWAVVAWLHALSSLCTGPEHAADRVRAQCAVFRLSDQLFNVEEHRIWRYD
jgi:hypothetical protein